MVNLSRSQQNLETRKRFQAKTCNLCFPISGGILNEIKIGRVGINIKSQTF